MKVLMEFLNIIEDKGFKAYIVGGYVRDYLLGVKSYDVDVTTNATPKQIKEIFKNVELKKNPISAYGSLVVNYKNINFEVTTFRIESDYLDNRHPTKIEYTDNLEIDLKRRDFTINAICMDKKGKIIDPINGRNDLKKKIIRTIGDSNKSFHDDALRILRAIRFATVLNFKLDNNVILAIANNKKYLKNISYERKKIELEQIFVSKNNKYGISLIKKLGLQDVLELHDLDRIKDYTDLIGIWSMINPSSYRFTKVERELIKKVNIVYNLDNLDNQVLYKYGLYVNVLAGINKGISKKKITEKYNKLPIKSKSDIKVNVDTICNILNKKPGSFLNNVYMDLENVILDKKLDNNDNKIIKYIKEKYLEE